MDQQEILSKVRDKLTSGALPRTKYPMTWVGPGTGDFCAVCDAPFRTTDVEIECASPSGPALSFHSECFRTWEKERLQ